MSKIKINDLKFEQIEEQELLEQEIQLIMGGCCCCCCGPQSVKTLERVVNFVPY